MRVSIGASASCRCAPHAPADLKTNALTEYIKETDTVIVIGPNHGLTRAKREIFYPRWDARELAHYTHEDADAVLAWAFLDWLVSAEAEQCLAHLLHAVKPDGMLLLVLETECPNDYSILSRTGWAIWDRPMSVEGRGRHYLVCYKSVKFKPKEEEAR